MRRENFIITVCVSVGVFVLAGSLICFGANSIDGKTLQAKLDAGEDISLEPGQVIELNEPLLFRKAGQRIETVGAETAAQYARIVLADGPQGTLIEAKGIAGAALTKLILDGNRPGYLPPEGLAKKEPMLSFGGEGATGQSISNCIVLSSRCAGGWAAIHLHEGGDGILVKDNLIFSSGTDLRGNGRSLVEKPWGMADGISTASRNTTISNNLIYDAVDEGIMVQGAPGTLVKNNVIVALSREMLGGIALIDPFGYYELDSEKRTFDYRGVVVEDNLILAMGARIHAAIPLGGATWNYRFKGTTLVGATVQNNALRGDALGYGIAVNGVDGFVVEGNTFDAECSGIGDGAPDMLPDPAAPLLFDPSAIGTSKLQEGFVPVKTNLVGVLRSNRKPVDALGYRDAAYPETEARAVVRFVFVEMLGRDPTVKESQQRVEWLIRTRFRADALRRSLMMTPEFVQKHGQINPIDLHAWRNDRWLKMILEVCSELQTKGTDWPNAVEWNERVIRELRK